MLRRAELQRRRGGARARHRRDLPHRAPTPRSPKADSTSRCRSEAKAPDTANDRASRLEKKLARRDSPAQNRKQIDDRVARATPHRAGKLSWPGQRLHAARARAPARAGRHRHREESSTTWSRSRWRTARTAIAARDVDRARPRRARGRARRTRPRYKKLPRPRLRPPTRSRRRWQRLDGVLQRFDQQIAAGRLMRSSRTTRARPRRGTADRRSWPDMRAAGTPRCEQRSRSAASSALRRGSARGGARPRATALGVTPDLARATQLKTAAEGKLGAARAAGSAGARRSQTALAEQRCVPPAGARRRAIRCDALKLDPTNAKQGAARADLPRAHRRSRRGAPRRGRGEWSSAEARRRRAQALRRRTAADRAVAADRQRMAGEQAKAARIAKLEQVAALRRDRRPQRDRRIRPRRDLGAARRERADVDAVHAAQAPARCTARVADRGAGSAEVIDGRRRRLPGAHCSRPSRARRSSSRTSRPRARASRPRNRCGSRR